MGIVNSIYTIFAPIGSIVLPFVVTVREVGALVLAMEQMNLGEFLLSHIGQRRSFRSLRQLSLAAGMSQNAVGNIIERNRGEPDSLAKLAKALDIPVTKLFELAGWLTQEGDSASRLSQDEEDVLNIYRLIPLDRRRPLREVMEAMLMPPSPQQKGSQEAT